MAPGRIRMTQSFSPIPRAWAKLNLYLEIVGKRPDGFHELRTLFQTVGLADDIRIRMGEGVLPGVRCTVEGADLPTDSTNLAVRAAEEWLRATGLAEGIELQILKRIPIGGGLGGGSSDAASVLNWLQHLRPKHALAPAALEGIARALGADVPFLLDGGYAEAMGRGDVITQLPAPPPLAYVLIVPPFGTETAKVYARAHERLRHAPENGLAAMKAAVASGVPARIRDAHHNDLAEAAIRAYPELLRFTSKTERLLGRPPCMTGSGSTLFDVPDANEIDEVVEKLVPLPGRRVVVRPARGDRGRE